MLSARLSPAAPYTVGAGALVVSIGVLLLGRRHLAHLDAGSEPETLSEQAAVLTAADS